MAKQGTLEFSSDNYILFIASAAPPKGGFCECTATDCTNQHAEESDGPSHMMEWKSTPAAMAKALRKAADWLEKHADRNINAEID